MATIGGLSGSTSNSVNMYGTSIKGFGGLASGMETDSLIEGMTQGTRTKIQELLKKKDKYQWQTDAYRSVSDALINLSSKYLDVKNANSPFRASFYDKNLATATGKNSSKVSITGAGSLLDKMEILEVSQLARDASYVSKDKLSGGSFELGKMNFDDVVTSTVNGGSIKFTYGTETYSIAMISGEELEAVDGTKFNADYSNPANITKALHAKLKSTKLKDDPTKNLADIVSIGNSSTSTTAKFTLQATAAADATKLSISSTSTGAMKALGLMNADGTMVNGGKFVDAGGAPQALAGSEVSLSDLSTSVPFYERFDGKAMTFSYNGVSRSVKLPTKDEWKGIVENADGTKKSEADIVDGFADYMQKKMDSAFGSGKIDVTGSVSGGLMFKTTATDASAVLKIPDADIGVLGEGNLFEVDYGIGNRLNLNATLEECGFQGLGSDWKDADGKVYLEMNGVEIEGITASSTLSQIISAINKSDAGVKVSYLETADSFSITSTKKGSAGEIYINSDKKGTTTQDNLASLLFGKKADLADLTSGVKVGQDAKMKVMYDGAATVEITRDSNNFNLDGTTFNLTGTFSDESVKFTTSTDVDKVTKTIGDMISDYNKIIENVQSLVSTKPDRDYSPLTDDEKSQLSEKQIEKLEGKAKEGILFNDSLLRTLSDRLRTVFSGVADVGTLKNMGITVGSNYKDGGKIIFDETKFKSALQEDPEKIKTMFTKPEVKDSKGDITDPGGVTARLKNITDTFAKNMGSEYGSLIVKAGSTSASNSLLKNSLKTLMDDIDQDVKQLKIKLQTEIDRYTKQFSSLEQLVSQMNSQSSALSSMMGG